SAQAYFRCDLGAARSRLALLMLKRCAREFQSALARIVWHAGPAGAVRPGLNPHSALICGTPARERVNRTSSPSTERGLLASPLFPATSTRTRERATTVAGLSLL